MLTPLRANEQRLRGGDIRAAVCLLVGVSEPELCGSSRHPALVFARGLYVTCCRRWTVMSFPDVSRSLGRRNHSSPITAWQRHRREAAQGKAYEARTYAEWERAVYREVVGRDALPPDERRSADIAYLRGEPVTLAAIAGEGE